ncbi:hypothetical protein SH501x_001077 [Pirellulaceae bacterium SH501]
MLVQFRCPCGANLRSNASISGKKITCPKCGKALLIKVQESEPPVEANPWDSMPSFPETTPYRNAPSPHAPSLPYGNPVKKPFPTSLVVLIGLVVGGFALLGSAAGLVYYFRDQSLAGSFRPLESASPIADPSSVVVAPAPNPIQGSSPNTNPPSASDPAAETGNTENHPPQIFRGNLVHDGVYTLAKSDGGDMGIPKMPFYSSLETKAQTYTYIPTAGLTPLQIGEKFANYAKQGWWNAAVRMMSEQPFDKRQQEGPTPSAEALGSNIPGGKVLVNFSTKSFESTPYDDRFRHWRVLGESTFMGQPAVLLRYYADPDSPQKRFTTSGKLAKDIKVINLEEFQKAAPELMFPVQGRRQGRDDQFPDYTSFLPPRFGYLMLVLEPAEDGFRLVDLVNVMGQVPLSQVGASIFLQDWRIFSHGNSGKFTYAERLKMAEKAGQMERSIYGNYPRPYDGVSSHLWILTPQLWYLPPEPDSAEKREQKDKWLKEWVSSRTESRTVHLVPISHALDRRPEEAAQLIAEFQRKHPGDPGADLAVMTFAMTPLQPRLPESLLPVIDQSATRLYEMFKDPMMLYVRALVHEAKGDRSKSDRYLQQAASEGFLAARTVMAPYEKAIDRGDKETALAALREISAYWATAVLDRSSDMTDQITKAWVHARNLADGYGNSSSAVHPTGTSKDEPEGWKKTRERLRETRNTDRLPPQTQPDYIDPQMKAGFGDESTRKRDASPPLPSTPNGGDGKVLFIIQSKSRLDPMPLVQKLTTRLGTKNHQMSGSGNSARITVGFSGSFEEAAAAVDFGEVIAKDSETRTITVEMP